MAHDKNNFVTHLFANLVCIILLCTSQTAHADFRKALTAYQNRDGKTMLAEVQDAVDKKNDDGLVLFLMATNLDAVTSDYDETTQQSKSTLRAILPQPKWDEMRELLMQVTDNSGVDVQYHFNVQSQFSPFYRQQVNIGALHERYKNTVKKYAELNSYAAIKQKYNESRLPQNRQSKADYLDQYDGWLIKFAEAGNPFAQLELGLKYHNYVGDFGCDVHNEGQICGGSSNVEKGNFWLKRSVESYESSAHDDVTLMYQTLCKFSQLTNSIDTISTFGWCSLANIKALEKPSDKPILLPEWLKAARIRLTKKDVPIATIYVNELRMRYEIDIYSNGEVNAVIGDEWSGYKDRLVKFPKQKLNQFLKAANKLAATPISDKKLDTIESFCGDCLTTNVTLIVRKNNKIKRLSVTQPYEKNPIKNDNNIFIGKVVLFTEEYFKLNKLLFGLGEAEAIRNNQLSRFLQWSNLARKDK